MERARPPGPTARELVCQYAHRGRPRSSRQRTTPAPLELLRGGGNQGPGESAPAGGRVPLGPDQRQGGPPGRASREGGRARRAEKLWGERQGLGHSGGWSDGSPHECIRTVMTVGSSGTGSKDPWPHVSIWTAPRAAAGRAGGTEGLRKSSRRPGQRTGRRGRRLPAAGPGGRGQRAGATLGLARTVGQGSADGICSILPGRKQGRREEGRKEGKKGEGTEKEAPLISWKRSTDANSNPQRLPERRPGQWLLGGLGR